MSNPTADDSDGVVWQYCPEWERSSEVDQRRRRVCHPECRFLHLSKDTGFDVRDSVVSKMSLLLKDSFGRLDKTEADKFNVCMPFAQGIHCQQGYKCDALHVVPFAEEVLDIRHDLKTGLVECCGRPDRSDRGDRYQARASDSREPDRSAVLVSRASESITTALQRWTKCANFSVPGSCGSNCYFFHAGGDNGFDIRPGRSRMQRDDLRLFLECHTCGIPQGMICDFFNMGPGRCNGRAAARPQTLCWYFLHGDCRNPVCKRPHISPVHFRFSVQDFRCALTVAERKRQKKRFDQERNSWPVTGPGEPAQTNPPSSGEPQQYQEVFEWKVEPVTSGRIGGFVCTLCDAPLQESSRYPHLHGKRHKSRRATIERQEGKRVTYVGDVRFLGKKLISSSAWDSELGRVNDSNEQSDESTGEIREDHDGSRNEQVWISEEREQEEGFDRPFSVNVPMEQLNVDELRQNGIIPNVAPQYTCVVCNVPVNGLKNCLSHVRGERHIHQHATLMGRDSGKYGQEPDIHGRNTFDDKDYKLPHKRNQPWDGESSNMRSGPSKDATGYPGEQFPHLKKPRGGPKGMEFSCSDVRANVRNWRGPNQLRIPAMIYNLRGLLGSARHRYDLDPRPRDDLRSEIIFFETALQELTGSARA